MTSKSPKVVGIARMSSTKLQQSDSDLIFGRDEENRLKDLNSLGVLDTDPEPRFERITKLMAITFKVPIALISLVDQDRQWFKSHYGLECQETPREHSFCARAIKSKEPYLIEDALHHTLYKDNPLVLGKPHIRAYAGVPIHGPMGYLVGTCCIIDHKARSFSQDEIEQLVLFAQLAEAELERHFSLLKMKEEAHTSTFYDPVTGLPNQNLFLARLDQAVISISGSARINVCVVHLCRFAELNQIRGKAWADKVMFFTAIRLRGSLPITTMVARLEGAKIAIFDIDKEADSYNSHKALAKKVFGLCEQEIRIDNEVFHTPVKIGVSRYPDTDETPEVLLEQAKAASKQNATINYFSKVQSATTNRRFDIEQQLLHALKENRFHMVYQPIVDIQSGELKSLEALIRLEVEDGPISPEEFIPIAEDTGLILPVGEWVLRAVCNQMGIWQTFPGHQNIPVAVNLASEQMGLKNLESLVLSAVYDNNLSQSQLQLEVTETSLMKNIDRAILNMENILKHGIHFSLDDFGTGYSSLSYLQRLPIRKVKLDRAFIQNIDTNEHDRVMAKNIINLCHELGKITVAEGIETKAQLEVLQNLGCDLGQGYYFSRPLTSQAFNERLSQEKLVFP